MRALTWPNAFDSPNLSMMRLAAATSLRKACSLLTTSLLRSWEGAFSHIAAGAVTAPGANPLSAFRFCLRMAPRPHFSPLSSSDEDPGNRLRSLRRRQGQRLGCGAPAAAAALGRAGDRHGRAADLVRALAARARSGNRA